MKQDDWVQLRVQCSAVIIYATMTAPPIYGFSMLLKAFRGQNQSIITRKDTSAIAAVHNAEYICSIVLPQPLMRHAHMHA